MSRVWQVGRGKFGMMGIMVQGGILIVVERICI